MSIEKKVARELLPLVNSELYDLLQEYAAYRIAQLQKEIERVEPDQLKLLQGALKELRNIQGLRDQVNQDSK